MLLVIGSIARAVRINIWLIVVGAVIVSESLIHTLDHGSVVIQLWIVVWLLLLVVAVLPLLLGIVWWRYVSLAMAGLRVVSAKRWLIYVLLALVDALEVIIVVDR